MYVIHIDEVQRELLIAVLSRAAYGINGLPGTYGDEVEKLLNYITSVDDELPDVDYNDGGD